jgi:hypothetical protein
MQTKGGGKHDILSVARATVTTLDCLWMMPRDPDADMCPGTATAPVSTEECMAHQSCIPTTHDLSRRSNFVAFPRVASQVGVSTTQGGVHGEKASGERPH